MKNENTSSKQGMFGPLMIIMGIVIIVIPLMFWTHEANTFITRFILFVSAILGFWMIVFGVVHQLQVLRGVFE